jgi:hypothetical protein
VHYGALTDPIVIAALILLILSVFGITPSDEELLAYEAAYWSRVHHVFVDIGSQIDESGIGPAFAIGYEALLDPGGRGGAFEVTAEANRPFTEYEEYFFGAGGGHYFLPKLRVALTGGALIRPKEDVLMRGRLEVGGRFQVFSMTINAYVRFLATTDGTFDFGFGGRFEY